MLGQQRLGADRRARARHGRALRAGGGHRAGPGGGPGDGRAAGVHVRAGLPRPGGARRARARSPAVVRRLFEHYVEHPELLPGARSDGAIRTRRRARGASSRSRVTDYLAGMTDRYCIREYTELAGAAGVRPLALPAWRSTRTSRGTASATRSTSSSWSRRARSCAGRARRATRDCARSTTSARRRSGSTRRRRSTTASAARPRATCSRSCRRPRGWTSRARSSCWPSATGSSCSASRRIRARPSGARRRERLLELLERARPPTTSATCGSRSEAAQGARVPAGQRAAGGDPARVPRGLRAERVGQAAARLASRRLLRAGAVRDGPGAALQAERPALRPLPLADHVPARRHPRAGARLRRAGDRPRRGGAAAETGGSAEVSEHLRQRRLPQGPSPVRREPRAARRRAGGGR